MLGTADKQEFLFWYELQIQLTCYIVKSAMRYIYARLALANSKERQKTVWEKSEPEWKFHYYNNMLSEIIRKLYFSLILLKEMVLYLLFVYERVTNTSKLPPLLAAAYGLS